MLLSSRYELFDVSDVESVCQRVAGRYCASVSSHLEPTDVEDLTAFLLKQAWRCGERYDPKLGVPFSAFLRRTLPNRCVDWYRLRFGRSNWKWSDGTEYHRERPVPISLDAPLRGDVDERMGGAVPADAGNLASVGMADLDRFELDTGRFRDRDNRRIRLEADRRGEGRTQSRADA